MVYAVVDDVVTSYSPRIDSHRSGWTRILARANQTLLGDVKIAFDDHSLPLTAKHWLVAHPMEFNGETYNLFGGWNQEVADRVGRLLEYEGTLVSLERPMPNLRAILEPRSMKTDVQFTSKEWAKIERVCKNAQCDRGFPNTHSVVLGDSHSNAHYFPGYQVMRNDGLTLNRLVRDDLPILGIDCEHLVICGGNIDIRHHFGRHDKQNALTFASRLLVDLKARLDTLLQREQIERYTVVMPYPIEHEGRRIPKTGWYKGAPFSTPRQERVDLVDTWEDVAQSMFDQSQLFFWPDEWYTMDPEEYAKTYMEKPGSVHLSPRHYVWDFERNVSRYY